MGDSPITTAPALPLPLVHVVSTGGTIANTPGGRLPIDAVLAVVPEVSAIARVEVSEASRVGSSQLRPADWLAVASSVARAAADDRVAGVVITHGTFTHEETAYFLHLTVHTDKPVVVASSQRKHGTLGNDGDRNLLDAMRVATSPDARGLGVLSVLNGEVHSARDVVKTSWRPDGFRSRTGGVLGYVDADRVDIARRPLRRHTTRSEFDIERLGADLPRVDVVQTYVGADGLTIEPLIGRAHPSGIVVAGYAYSGQPATDQLDALIRAARDGVVVVLTNRGLGGRVPHPETGSVIEGRGFVGGDDLPPHKARILLMLALTGSTSAPDVQRVFDEY